ncbi:MAG: hypothetical protein AAGG75_25145 [Bacteroidota bacterium]
MSEELKDIALAEAYLNGELSEAQRQAVDTRRASDPTFAQLLADMEIMLEGTREAFRGDIEAQLRELEQGLPPVQIDEAALLLDDLPEEATQPPQPPPAPQANAPKGKQGRGWWYLVVAVVLLLLLLWWLWPRGEAPSQEQLFAEYFEAPARVGGPTRGGDELAELRRVAGEAYDGKDFAAAARYYERLFVEYRDTQALFYLGVAQLGAGAPTAAVENLREFGQVSEDVRFEATEYYIALAYLRKGEWEQALFALEGLEDPRANELRSAIQKEMKKSK